MHAETVRLRRHRDFGRPAAVVLSARDGWNRQHGGGPASLTLATSTDGRHTSGNDPALNTAEDGHLPQLHVVTIHRGQVAPWTSR